MGFGFRFTADAPSDSTLCIYPALEPASGNTGKWIHSAAIPAVPARISAKD